MSEDREKLLKIMNSLESDYRSGKISAEKYSYFRSKYEDKLNSIDAKAATRRIRSMQGKPSDGGRSNKKRKRPTKNKKKEEQDLVQKYIINPKKSDAKYNKKQKSSMDSGTFKLLLLLVLVVGFTAGTAYGIFHLDFGSISEAETVAIVDDTAFPEFNEDVVKNNTRNNTYNSSYSSNYNSYNTNNNVETTSDNSYNSYDSSSYQSSSSSQQQSSQSQSQSRSSSSGGSSSSQSSSSSGGSNSR